MKPVRPHNFYGGTTCPGRATGQVSTIRSLISEEEDDMPDPIFRAPDGSHAQVGAAGKIVIGHPEHITALVAGGAKIVDVTQGVFDAIPVTVTPSVLNDALRVAIARIAPGSGGGLTPDEAKESFKQAQREGTG